MLMQAQRVYGLALAQLEQNEEALLVLETQVRLSEASGDLWILSADLNNLAGTYAAMGAYEQARKSGARAVELAEQLGDLSIVVFTLTTLSGTAIVSGG